MSTDQTYRELFAELNKAKEQRDQLISENEILRRMVDEKPESRLSPLVEHDSADVLALQLLRHYSAAAVAVVVLFDVDATAQQLVHVGSSEAYPTGTDDMLRYELMSFVTAIEAAHFLTAAALERETEHDRADTEGER